jgi:hypothetical protein
MRYSMAAASLAHTYGNIATFANEFLISLFPPNYFKTNYINSTIAYRDFATFNNNRKEFIKKQKPMIIMKPRIEMDMNDELPINQTYLAQRIYDINNEDIESGNLQSFFYDRDNKRQIQFLLNSLRIVFDVAIIVETQMEQINLAHYFKNRVRQNWEMTKVVGLESYISRDIMWLLAKDAGYEDVFTTSEENRIGEFLSYVNKNSMYPVTIKYKNASGRHEFFRYHHSHVNMAITGLSIDDPSKKNMVSDECYITFSLRCDFNTAGLYVYLSNNDLVFDQMGNEGLQDSNLLLGNDKLVPIFTPQHYITNKTMPNGWHVVTMPAFEIDTNEVPYPLDLSVLLNTSLTEAYNYHKKHGIPMTMFLDAVVLKGAREMEVERNEYKIDWDNLKLYVYNCNITAEYRFIMFVNTEYLNNLLADIVKFREEK